MKWFIMISLVIFLFVNWQLGIILLAIALCGHKNPFKEEEKAMQEQLPENHKAKGMM